MKAKTTEVNHPQLSTITLLQWQVLNSTLLCEDDIDVLIHETDALLQRLLEDQRARRKSER